MLNAIDIHVSFGQTTGLFAGAPMRAASDTNDCRPALTAWGAS